MIEPTPGPLDRLRAANPVPHAVSHPDDATLEEILMTTTAPATETDPGSPNPSPEPKRLPLILGIAAALLLVVGVVGALAFSGDDDPATGEVAGSDGDEPAADPIDPNGGDGDPAIDPAAGGPAGGSEVTSCVESYSPETLANREYTFDGTITSVDGPNMTFEVNEWFSGGTEATVTLDHQGLAGGLLTPDIAIEPGTRVLIGGDGGFVWSCGFTQLWTEDTAAEWRAAVAG